MVREEIKKCEISENSFDGFLDLLYQSTLPPDLTIDQLLEVLVLCHIFELHQYTYNLQIRISDQMPRFVVDIIPFMVETRNKFEQKLSGRVLNCIMGLLASHGSIKSELAERLDEQLYLDLDNHVLKEWIVPAWKLEPNADDEISIKAWQLGKFFYIWGGLYNDISGLVENHFDFKGANVDLVIGSEVLQVHDWVLYGRWKYFRKLFDNNHAALRFTLSTHQDTGLSSDLWHFIIHYIYTLSLSDFSTEHRRLLRERGVSFDLFFTTNSGGLAAHSGFEPLPIDCGGAQEDHPPSDDEMNNTCQLI